LESRGAREGAISILLREKRKGGQIRFGDFQHEERVRKENVALNRWKQKNFDYYLLHQRKKRKKGESAVSSRTKKG